MKALSVRAAVLLTKCHGIYNVKYKAALKLTVLNLLLSIYWANLLSAAAAK